MKENTSKTYTPEQMGDAKKLAETLARVPDAQRSTFALMVDAMMIGAQLADKRMADSGARA